MQCITPVLHELHMLPVRRRSAYGTSLGDVIDDVTWLYAVKLVTSHSETIMQINYPCEPLKHTLSYKHSALSSTNSGRRNIGATALQQKFETFHDVSMPTFCFAARSVKQTIPLRRREFSRVRQDIVRRYYANHHVDWLSRLKLRANSSTGSSVQSVTFIT